MIKLTLVNQKKKQDKSKLKDKILRKELVK